MDKNISKSIDFLRFPLAIAVVFLHLPGKYTNWSEWSWHSWANFSGCDILSLSTNVLFQVAVPIFFFISGYLFSYSYSGGGAKLFIKKTKSLLLPYLIWNLIALLLLVSIKMMGVLIHGNDIEPIIEMLKPSNLFYAFCGNFSQGSPYAPIDSPLWFIRNLYFFFLMSPILLYVIKKTNGIIVGCLFLIYILNLFEFYGLMEFVIGLYIGLRKIDFLKWISNYERIICFLAIFMGAIRLIFGFRCLMPLFILLSGCLVLNIYSHTKNLKIADIVISFKKYSFFIFAFHIILIQRFWTILHFRLLYSNEIMCCITYLIMPFVISGVCVVFYNLLEKKCPKLLAQLTGARNLK